MGQVRVTEVLNYFKEPWYIDWVCRVGKREANRISKASMKIGTRVDELIKSSSDPNKKDSNEVCMAMTGYLKWKDIYKPKSIIPGTRLNATIEGVEVTGEPDLYVDDVLVDIKCSAKIDPKYWVQVNMYEWLRSITPEINDFGKVAILRLDKTTGSFEYVVKDYDPRLVECWLGMMRMYCYLKENDNGAEL